MLHRCPAASGVLNASQCISFTRLYRRTCYLKCIRDLSPVSMNMFYNAEPGAVTEPFIPCPGLQVAGSRAGGCCSGRS